MSTIRYKAGKMFKIAKSLVSIMTEKLENPTKKSKTYRKAIYRKLT